MGGCHSIQHTLPASALTTSDHGLAHLLQCPGWVRIHQADKEKGFQQKKDDVRRATEKVKFQLSVNIVLHFIFFVGFSFSHCSLKHSSDVTCFVKSFFST